MVNIQRIDKERERERERKREIYMKYIILLLRNVWMECEVIETRSPEYL